MRSAWRLTLAAFITILTAVAPRAALSQPSPALAPPCTGSWEIVTTPNGDPPRA